MIMWRYCGLFYGLIIKEWSEFIKKHQKNKKNKDESIHWKITSHKSNLSQTQPNWIGVRKTHSVYL